MASKTIKKAKKKNAPDKPQPQWLHPPDEKNPVLNPKPKSEEQIKKAKAEWDHAINVLQHKSVGAPLKPPPPGLLLTLVGAFLSSYGFDSASRIYTTQLASRKKLDGWESELGKKLPKGIPDLVKIYKDWYKEYLEGSQQGGSSSEDEGEDDKSEEKPKSKKTTISARKNATPVSEETSSSGTSDDSSDEKASPTQKFLKYVKKSTKPKNATSVSEETSSSGKSDDSSDENASPTQKLFKNVKKSTKPKNAMSVSEETSSSGMSDGSSDENASRTQKPPKNAKKSTQPVSSASSTSSSTSTLETDSAQIPDNSNTSTPSSSSSESLPTTPPSNLAPTVPASSKRKRSVSPTAPIPVDEAKAAKKQRSHFQRVPKDTKVHAKLASNAYVAHEYGERAHQDLSITRGKEFTKEKNKKKRGGYRGGAIDVGGGKGIKFED